MSIGEQARKSGLEESSMCIHKLRYAALTAILFCLCCALAACGKSVTGTYTDPASGFTLELKSGGEATITFMGNSGPCTYKVDGNQVAVTCQGQAGGGVFTIQSDGSLAPPPGAPMPILKKTK
jgi:hypothetical protein